MFASMQCHPTVHFKGVKSNEEKKNFFYLFKIQYLIIAGSTDTQELSLLTQKRMDGFGFSFLFVFCSSWVSHEKQSCIHQIITQVIKWLVSYHLWSVSFCWVMIFLILNCTSEKTSIPYKNKRLDRLILLPFKDKSKSSVNAYVNLNLQHVMKKFNSHLLESVCKY